VTRGIRRLAIATTSHHPQRFTGYDAILGDTLRVVLVVP
jgi:hypothetical protein